tara:strand:+ start:149 stop:2038 length:1890 start_codon:yes stop_codon:yes gene_type:complete
MKNMDPIAMFLEYQLPQMVARANEAKKNRLHELDVLEKKAKINKESQEYASLLKLSTDKISNLDTQIATKSQLLTNANIGVNLADNINELEKTSGKDALMNDYINKVNSSRNTDIDEYNKELDLMGALTNEINLRQSQNDELDSLLVGMQTGRSRSKEVTDLNNDGIKSMTDFNLFLEKMENPYQVGSAEHAGFISMAPGEKEVLDMQIKLFDLKQKEANIAYKEAQTWEIYNKPIRELVQNATKINANYAQGINKYLSSSLDSISGTASILNNTDAGKKFLNETVIDYRNLIPSATMDYTTPLGQVALNDMKLSVQENLIGVMDFHNKENWWGDIPVIDKNVKEYKRTTDPDQKQIYFDSIVKALERPEIINRLDFNNDIKDQATQFIKGQVQTYNFIKNTATQINGQDKAGNIKPQNNIEDTLGLLGGQPEASIEEPATVETPEITLEQLNQSIAKGAQDAQSIQEPGIKSLADNILRQISSQQANIGSSDITSMELENIKNEIIALTNERKEKTVPEIERTVNKGTLSSRAQAISKRTDEIDNRLTDIKLNILPKLSGNKLGGSGIFSSGLDIDSINEYINTTDKNLLARNNITKLLSDLDNYIAQDKKISNIDVNEIIAPFITNK